MKSILTDKERITELAKKADLLADSVRRESYIDTRNNAQQQELYSIQQELIKLHIRLSIIDNLK
jgi:hypothetical protein